MVENARQERDNALKCLLDCLISCLDSLAQYLNRWAYTYIGIYGHSFVEAGHKVYNLFVRRGLTALLNDNLVGRVLFLGALMVGLVTCGLGVLLAFILQHSYLKDVENAPSLLGGAGFVVRPLVSLLPLPSLWRASLYPSYRRRYHVPSVHLACSPCLVLATPTILTCHPLSTSAILAIAPAPPSPSPFFSSCRWGFL
ncbi:Choline transporter [Nannochloropsis gaditana]|uniref:Choline transporter-like protein n=1 Tax=Nannochloropsis gaditana TaxID=72520 RepID=W7TJF9_9STRA|nr:Choline transporter [Nannochloropsis gaditana]